MLINCFEVKDSKLKAENDLGKEEDPLDPLPTYGYEDFYVGGNVDFFDYCDKDFMSLLEVDNMVEELGYGNVFMSYQYKDHRDGNSKWVEAFDDRFRCYQHVQMRAKPYFD
ncbi:hypothetical protein D8674_012472 [Pyrus ussuriensis x Pyrus communis]|uniref:PB1-like domain-containing protein n=1 Tax=Pyrus ussuriensis x Pyrus communis TaxID=2448454 RepID=A0A5N5GF15_9ROSA|nr:hypothetical protein D8674_012472 [Pyrus ussuriensis x Pyrus communis]